VAEGFEELGVGAELVTELRGLGIERPTGIQRAAVPVLRRGANAVIHAAPGAGATAAYGIALVERLVEQNVHNQATQALVVTPTEDRAMTAALELGRIGRSSNVRSTVQTLAWLGEAAVVVVPVTKVLSLIQSSRLKLEEAKTVVLHDLSAMLSLGYEQSIETLLSTIPRDAQRVIISSELTAGVEKLVEAHARKALHVPARPAVPSDVPIPTTPGVQLEYRVASPPEAAQALALLASRAPTSPVVFVRSEQFRDQLKDELSLRGIAAEVRLYGERAIDDRPSFGYGAPFDLESLTAAFARGGALVIDARQLAHLRNLARAANADLRSAPTGTPRDAAALERFREQVRRAISEEDLDAQLLVLAPLLEEFSAAEVAAATAALIRKRAPAPTPLPPSSTPAAGPSFVKLFVSIGQRDGITARDLVGAITGEAGVSGDQVGRVDIRDTFSIVEVSAGAGDKVIQKLNGTSLRGRSLRVDYDRPRTGGPQRSPGPPRRSRPKQGL
jgi:ATP-dependent RNA helicase DeaD